MKTRIFWLGAVAVLFATAALAHAQLVSATPAVGATVASAPGELKLKFSEGVEPRFSSVALSDATGAAVALGALTVDAGD